MQKHLLRILAENSAREFWLRVRVTCENSHNFMTSQTVLPPQVHQVMADHATNTYFMHLRVKEEARITRIKSTPGHHQHGAMARKCSMLDTTAISLLIGSQQLIIHPKIY